MYNSRISPRKMVRNKRDLKFSPLRNRPISRTISRVGSKPSDSASSISCANVKVVVRVRPPNQKESGSNSRTVVKIVDDNMIVFDPKEENEPFFYHGVQQRSRDLLKKVNKNIQFLFDRVFGYDVNNAQVFEHSTKNLIPSLMDGYNCSVFVYGATGAGKTHTMLGQTDNPGITFLTMKELFTQMEQFRSEREFDLAITYLEVYNETVKDLLNPGAPLHLREDGKFGVIVSGIKIHKIKSPEELFALLAEGNSNRTQHPTDANAESSRSHAVFQVYINMQFRNTGQRRVAKLSMIDLAGSERGAATGCTGIRFTEGANINKSLLALGNCINSLADGHKHIPYRDSKLTRILKDSLGGNCQTVMIANVSPTNLNYEDTYNTLKYATRAKKIKSNMTKNVVNSVLTIAQYQKLIEDLNKENESLKEEVNKLKVQSETVSSASSCTSNDNKENIPLSKKELPWKAQLKSMLKEKNGIQKQIQRLLLSEEVLKQRIKFKDFSESLISCVEDEQIEANLGKVPSTVAVYQRKLNSIQAQIQDLKSQLRAITTKIQYLIESEEIPANDSDLLQSEVDIKSNEIDLQREHTKNVLDICQVEIDHKEKMMTKMLNVLSNYYQLLKINGSITDNMADDYLNIIRMVRGVRSVTWQDENDVIETKSQDSGININRTPSAYPTPKSNTRSFTPNKSIGSSGTRTTVKRKLYEIETKSTSAIDDFIKKHLTTDTQSQTMTNLNETIVLTEPIDGDNINSTFCLNNKDPIPKKKSTLYDRNNENVLTKGSILKKSTLKEKSNVRTINSRLYGTTSKPQKYPLKHEAASTNRATKTTSSTLRVNRFKS